MSIENEKFSRGDRVWDTYSKRIGYITGKPLPFGESLRWPVRFGESDPEYIRESYLELIPNEDDMFALFRQCYFDGVLDLRRIIQQIRIDGTLTNLFYSMHNSTTQFMPHQFKPVMKFIESATGRLLIADEVGLGKTIEAIYIWKELLTRENAKRFLIVCPAQLRQKWKNDLSHYFGIQSSILDATELLERLKDIKNFNSDNFVLITSIQGIRYRDLKNENSKKSNIRYKLNNFFEEFDINYDRKLFDLVVIDEAHYLRNNTTASFETGKRLRDISEYMILLSATPIQTHSKNLYNLLNLLSPEDFYNHFIFDEMLAENKSLITFANALGNNIPKTELLKFYKEELKEKMEDDKLKKEIEKYLENDINFRENQMSLFRSIKDTNFYSQYFTRTRKRDVIENRILREAKTLNYSFSDEEKEKYDEVTGFLKNLSNSSNSNVFTLIARQRQMTSCLPAALKHWKDHNVMQEVLYEDMGFDEDDENNYFNSTLNDLPNINVSEEMIKKFTENDSKYKKLKNAIKNILNENNREKIIIFSFYRYTINYLFERLCNDGYICEKIMGGIGDEKNVIIERFRDSSNCNILISSEVGSEGIDLQFASIEINYDLPWNPMRLEQRIGRIDRIGQKREKIRILNFICQDTIEDKVMAKLYERIDIFKNSIGDIEEILGDKINQLSIELFKSNLTDEEKLKQAEQTIQAIANNKIENERLEEQSGLSAEFSDLILKNIKNAEFNKRYIMAEELIQYTLDFFSLKYAGTQIEKYDDKSCFITLSYEAKMKFREYVRSSPYRVLLLGYTTDPVLCIFSNNKDAYKKFKNYELIDINHVFIKWMKDSLKQESLELSKCSAIKIKKDKITDIHNGLYIYYIQRWNTEGYKKTNELKYFVINADTRDIINENLAEKLVINSLIYGDDFSESKYGLKDIDKLYSCLEECRKYGNIEFNKFDVNFSYENEIIYNRSKEYLNRTYIRKLKSINEQINRAKEIGQSQKILRMYDGKKKKTENDFDYQLKKLEEKKIGRAIPSEIAVGLIKVED